MEHVRLFTSILDVSQDGGGIVISCIASLIMWHSFGFRDEKELQPTFKIKMLRDGDVCTLQMSGVTLKMSGEYRCVAVNSAGEAVCAANVAVVGEFA